MVDLNASPLWAYIVIQFRSKIGLTELHFSIAIGIPKVFAMSIVTPPVSPRPGVSQRIIGQILFKLTSTLFINLVSDLHS